MRENYDNIWTFTWQERGLGFSQGIAKATQKIKQWNKVVFGNIFGQGFCKHGSSEIQQSINYNTSQHLQDLEGLLIQELISVLDQEEILRYQKSWSNWVQNGDRNTSYYH